MSNVKVFRGHPFSTYAPKGKWTGVKSMPTLPIKTATLPIQKR